MYISIDTRRKSNVVVKFPFNKFFGDKLYGFFLVLSSNGEILCRGRQSNTKTSVYIRNWFVFLR